MASASAAACGALIGAVLALAVSPSTFAEDLSGFAVVAECDELGMPQAILRRPFEKLNRRDQVGFEPSAQLHILLGEPLAPTSFAALGQIHE